MKLTKNLIFLLSAFYFLLSNVFAAEIPENLKDAINSKSKALQEINQKILETQKDLEETAGKGHTLQKEIKNVNARIKQLDLNIRASGINIEKLGLEITSLNDDLKDIRAKISLQKSGIEQLLQEIQKKDNENLLIVFLKIKVCQKIWPN